MWRSPSSHFLLRALLSSPAKPACRRWREPPVLPLGHLASSFSASPPQAATWGWALAPLERNNSNDGEAPPADSIASSGAKRPVNLEALKQKLFADGEEVLDYGELLEACEWMVAARLRGEAASFARVLDEPASSFSLGTRNWSVRPKLGGGHCCRNYATSVSGVQPRRVEDRVRRQGGSRAVMPSEQDDQRVGQKPRSNPEPLHQQMGRRISATDKRKFLVNTLLDLKDSKEAVYGTLDAWVAWEQNFPLASLKKALLVLEKEQQWHRVVQVVKWMLSKGQGTTMGTYEQLIRALEKDNRAEEAHKIWMKKISHDLHSVPWRFCDLMLSIYYRNNMLERLVKLFKGLEAFDRKPPSKLIVQKVADAYELLGLVEDKNKVLEKYSHLFTETSEHCKKSRKGVQKKDKKTDKKQISTEASDQITWDSGPSDEEPDVAFEDIISKDTDGHQRS